MLAPVRSLILAAVAAAPLTAGAQADPGPWDPAAVARLKAVVAAEHRGGRDRPRDRYRNPVETLAFCRIRPDMTMVEVWPGTGWYTRILAPYLKDRGRLYVAAYEPGVIRRNATNA